MIMQQIGQRPHFNLPTPGFAPSPLMAPPLMESSGIGVKQPAQQQQAGQSGGLMNSIMKIFGQQGGAAGAGGTGGEMDMAAMALKALGMGM